MTSAGPSMLGFLSDLLLKDFPLQIQIKYWNKKFITEMGANPTNVEGLLYPKITAIWTSGACNSSAPAVSFSNSDLFKTNKHLVKRSPKTKIIQTCLHCYTKYFMLCQVLGMVQKYEATCYPKKHPHHLIFLGRLNIFGENTCKFLLTVKADVCMCLQQQEPRGYVCTSYFSW